MTHDPPRPEPPPRSVPPPGGVVVVGQLARDLLVRVDELPATGAAATARGRSEMLGGHGRAPAAA